MRARIIGLVVAAALVAPVLFGQATKASAATAQFFVTGYVLRGLTATGTYVHPGTCAVDPRIIPLGSYFTISGLGTCHAEDTGGAIVGYRIDVWVATVSQAYAITGWYTVTWGVDTSQQVLGYHASAPRAPVQQPAPVRRAVTHPYRPYWYSRGNAYLHHPISGYAASTAGSSAYILSSRHARRSHTH